MICPAFCTTHCPHDSHNDILDAPLLDCPVSWEVEYDVSDFIYINYWLIGLVGRVFTNDPGDLGSIPGCVIPKTLKMVLNTSLFNTEQYKVCIKGKVEQSRERSSALPYTSV